MTKIIFNTFWLKPIKQDLLPNCSGKQLDELSDLIREAKEAKLKNKTANTKPLKVDDRYLVPAIVDFCESCCNIPPQLGYLDMYEEDYQVWLSNKSHRDCNVTWCKQCGESMADEEQVKI